MDRADSSRLAFTAFPEYFLPILNLCSNLHRAIAFFLPITRLQILCKSAYSSLGLDHLPFAMQPKRRNDSVGYSKKKKKSLSVRKEKTRGTIVFPRPFFFLRSIVTLMIFVPLLRFDLSARIGENFSLAIESITISEKKKEEEEEDKRREWKLTAAKTLFRSIAYWES